MALLSTVFTKVASTQISGTSYVTGMGVAIGVGVGTSWGEGEVVPDYRCYMAAGNYRSDVPKWVTYQIMEPKLAGGAPLVWGRTPFLDVTTTSTPAWQDYECWGTATSLDRSTITSFVWDYNAVGHIYTNRNGRPIWTDTGVAGNVRKVVTVSDTEVWFFIDAVDSGGKGTLRYFIWNSVTRTMANSGATLQGLSLYTTALLSVEVLVGPGDTLILIYEGSVRYITRTTKAITGVLCSVVAGGSGSDTQYHQVAGNRIWTIDGICYFPVSLHYGSIAIYRFDPATPTVVTAISANLWAYDNTSSSLLIKPELIVYGVEHDPVTGTTVLMAWIKERNFYDERRATSFRYVGIPLNATSWVTPVYGRLYDPPSSNHELYAHQTLAVIPSWEGASAHTVLIYRELTSITGGIPVEYAWHIKLWNEPTVHEVTVAISPSFTVAVSARVTHSVSVEVSIPLQISVDSSLTKTTYAYTSWMMEPTSYVAGSTEIDLRTSMGIVFYNDNFFGYQDGSSSLALGDGFVIYASGTKSVALSASLTLASTFDVQVAGVVHPPTSLTIDLASTFDLVVTPEVAAGVMHVVMSQMYVSTGIQWYNEFMGYVNTARADIGLPPYRNIADSPYSMQVTARVDMAQGHSTDMVDNDVFAHDIPICRPGWCAVRDRAALMNSEVASENIAMTLIANLSHTVGQVLTYDQCSPLALFTAWWDSPGHKENILHDWGPYWGSHMYSLIGVDGTRATPQFSPSYRYFSFAYFTNNFVYLKETSMEFIFPQYNSFVGATIGLLHQQWGNNAYANARLAFDAPYVLSVVASHSTGYSFRVAAQHAASTHYSVASSLVAEYVGSIRITPAPSIGYYDIQNQKVTQAVSSLWSLSVVSPYITIYDSLPRVVSWVSVEYLGASTVARSHLSEYESTPRAAASLLSEYESMPRAAASHLSEYESTPRAAASLLSEYGVSAKVAQVCDTYYSLLYRVGVQNISSSYLPSSVRTSSVVGYELSLRNRAAAEEDSRYSLHSSLVIAGSQAVTLLHNGTTYRVSDGYISSGKGDAGYTFECKILDLELFSRISVLDSIAVDFAGEGYTFVVTAKTINRSKPESIEAAISAVSPIKTKDSPYAGNTEYAPSTAAYLSEIIEATLGQSVTWGILDWLVPFGRARVADATPLSAANTILSCVGASIRSNPDGGVVVAYTYPTSWDKLKSISPAHVFDDTQDILSVASGYEYRKGFNRYRVLDSDPSFNDSIDWTQDTDNSLTGIAKVTPSPYRSSWELATTSELPITIEPLGEKLTKVVEVLEFIKGKANLSQPILELTALEWLSVPLGGVAYDAYSTSLSAPLGVNEGYGLIRVTYNSKSFKFKVSSPTGVEAVQLVVKEN